MRKNERGAGIALFMTTAFAVALGTLLVVKVGAGAALIAAILAGFVMLIAAGLWEESGAILEWLLPLRGRWARTLVTTVGFVLSFGLLLYLMVAPILNLPLGAWSP